ncbi:MAG: hypothetical protein VX715_08310 [Planctomycetota bacterium]|nr:hypothetical protein [Planctomycetota bacterium]
MRSRTILTGLLLLLVSLSLPGCQRDKIGRYTVERLKTDRTLAVLVPDGKTAWYFKLTGPATRVADREQDFRSLVGSIQLVSNAPPEWKLPADWEQQPGEGMRYATLQYSKDGSPLELSVIPLPIGDVPIDQYVLQNVNRWRNELKLKPIEAADLVSQTEAVQVGDATATMVNLLGSRDNSRRPPFMDAPPTPPVPPAGGTAGSSGEVNYTAPEGWQESTLSQLRKAAYIVQEGDLQVEITIIPLSAQAGSLLPNINRWRGQVGLAEVNQQQMESELEKVTVGDVEGVYVRLQAPEGAEKQQTILGVIAVRGARSWFIKLNGDSQLADRETENFKQFVSSIQFTD